MLFKAYCNYEGHVCLLIQELKGQRQGSNSGLGLKISTTSDLFSFKISRFLKIRGKGLVDGSVKDSDFSC